MALATTIQEANELKEEVLIADQHLAQEPKVNTIELVGLKDQQIDHKEPWEDIMTTQVSLQEPLEQVVPVEVDSEEDQLAAKEVEALAEEVSDEVDQAEEEVDKKIVGNNKIILHGTVG